MRHGLKPAIKSAFYPALLDVAQPAAKTRYFTQFSAAAGSHIRLNTVNLNAGDIVTIEAQMDAGAATRYLIDGDDASERCFVYISYTTQLIKLSSTRVDPNSILLDGVAVTGDIAAPNDGKIHTLQFTVSQPCKIGYIACSYSVASFLDQIFMSLSVERSHNALTLIDLNQATTDLLIDSVSRKTAGELINTAAEFAIEHVWDEHWNAWRSTKNILPQNQNFSNWVMDTGWYNEGAAARNQTSETYLYVRFSRPAVYLVTIFGTNNGMYHYDGSNYLHTAEATPTRFYNKNTAYPLFAARNKSIPEKISSYTVEQLIEVA